MKVSRKRIEELRAILQGSVFAVPLFAALDERDELLAEVLAVIMEVFDTGEFTENPRELMDEIAAILRGTKWEWERKP